MNIFKIGLIPQPEAPAAAEGEVQPLQDPQLQELVSITTYAEGAEACKACEEGKVEGVVYATPEALPQPQGEEMLMNVSEQVRMACATSAADAEQTAAQLQVELITDCIRRLNDTARRDFLITRPRVAVLSLHADDQHEETEILMPAIDEAMADGINVFGPFPPVAFFEQGDYRYYDVILALYPQQAKTLLSMTPSEEAAAYLTQSKVIQAAPCSSKAIVDAIFLVKDVLRNRRAFSKAYNDPLQKLYHEKRER